MKKKIPALLLALSLLLTVPAHAALEPGFSRQRTYAGEFSDLDASSPFYDNVAALYEYGLANGKADGTFGLQDSLTVGQVVIFAGRVRSLYRTGDAESGPAAYRQESAPTALAYLRYLQAEGVLGAELDGQLAAPATRAEVAAMLARPLARLSAAARRMAEGDLSQRVRVDGDDEIAQLSADFNVMALRIQRQVAELKAAPVEVAVMEADQAAIDKARAEGEAAKAAEVAALQEQLKKAKESQRKAEEDRGAAEEALAGVKSQMEELSKAQRQTAVLSDPDVAKFQVYFDQVQESVNKMRGVLLKVKGREDPATAEKLTCAILALGEAVKGEIMKNTDPNL